MTPELTTIGPAIRAGAGGTADDCTLHSALRTASSEGAIICPKPSSARPSPAARRKIPRSLCRVVKAYAKLRRARPFVFLMGGPSQAPLCAMAPQRRSPAGGEGMRVDSAGALAPVKRKVL
jgi:hypothetical protein